MGSLSLSEAMQEFLKKSRLKGNMQAFQIQEVWEEIMGKTVARYTDKIQVIDKKLIIETSIGALKQELLYQKDKIRERVNEKMGDNTIAEVVVR
jgi:predicted nucleic acid-binding Zn ribbon protein